jgi:hypothetical protein
MEMEAGSSPVVHEWHISIDMAPFTIGYLPTYLPGHLVSQPRRL